MKYCFFKEEDCTDRCMAYSRSDPDFMECKLLIYLRDISLSLKELCNKEDDSIKKNNYSIYKKESKYE